MSTKLFGKSEGPRPFEITGIRWEDYVEMVVK
jgi:hypothetical protein